MSKEAFKSFVKKKPILAQHVKNNNTTWQQLYELFALYGENSSVWDEYLKEPTPNRLSNSFTDIINTIKGIDLDKIQNGIDSIQNTISLIQNFGSNNRVNNNTNNYEPRYRYHHMDD